jgi:monoamine oxidase
MANHIYDVVIVGAGVAGLTTAHELNQAGVADVIILEAQDYVGGRIQTSAEYGDPVELGAEFVHGRRIATWKYIDFLNLPTVSVGGAPKLIDRAGKEVTAKEQDQYEELNKLVETHGIPGVSVADITQAYRGTASQPIVDLVNDSIGDYEAGDADKLDSGAYSQMCELTKHNGANHVLPHGYRQLVDYLASRQRIYTSAVVRSVDTTEPQYVEVMLDNGERFLAKHVVVTVSLGVLKSRMIQFRPALSAAKQRVIRRLGMGRAVKYLLQFKTGKLVEELFHMADGENESLQTVSCWWQSASNHKILVGYAGGKRHDLVVGMDEQTLLQKVIRDLESMAGRPIRDELVSHKLIRWDNNPFVRGAYSNHPVGVGNDERAVLARPVANRLFFAGEAVVTSGNYATVHGAIESGQHTALRIAKLVKN